MADFWTQKHQKYAQQDWIDKPSLFAEAAVSYFPKQGKVLELGAGQGQDSRYFAGLGYEVTCTDNVEEALAAAQAKAERMVNLRFESVDVTQKLPFADKSFDVIYAHLVLHYFDASTTDRIFDEIYRVLKPNGILAFLVNSTSDPEYAHGMEIEPGLYEIEGKPKRFFNLQDAARFTSKFQPLLLDDQGETYKDRAKGVHNLIRFVGKKQS